ncbi:MAG: 2OG-Fe(II) oxygenase [Xanthomonadaceae bacterium]|nr:2OG-Fe(II) oxygenase [Xanthomonadaceae bacterium]
MSRYAKRWPVLDGGLLDPKLDVDSLAREFARTGRLQIVDALRPEVAHFLHRALTEDLPWSLAWRSRAGHRKTPLDQWSAMTTDERAAWQAEFDELARGGFQFLYLSYMMITGYMNGEAPDSPLNRVVELVNRGDWLEPMRAIIGDSRPRRTQCQATRYRPGDFLSLHNDFSPDETRYAAYVINLGRDWRTDQGGLLQLLDDQDRVIETMVPRFNTINLFRTPSLHCVSPVACHATGSRLAITGWLMD